MRLIWKSALGIALSAGLLVWTLRGESPAEIWAVISQSNLWLLALAAAVATAIFPLRAIRWLGFKAVGIDVPFSAANFLQGIIAVGVALPSSPGFFGVFEAAAKVGLEVYGVDGREAVSWAIGFHILSFIPITVIGLYYFARLGLRFSDFNKSGNEQR